MSQLSALSQQPHEAMHIDEESKDDQQQQQHGTATKLKATHQQQRGLSNSAGPNMRRLTGTRVLAPPPSSSSTSSSTAAHSSTSGIGVSPVVATSSTSSSSSSVSSSSSHVTSSLKKRSHASFQGEDDSSSASHLHPTQSAPKKSKQHVHHHTSVTSSSVAATPSQVVAQEMAKVRIVGTRTHSADSAMEDETTTTVLHTSITSSPSFVATNSTALNTSTDAISTEEASTPHNPPNTSNTVQSEISDECEETLDDEMEDRATPRIDPSHSSAAITPLTSSPSTTFNQQYTFQLPPSVYRSYRSKEPLIVAIDTVLDDFDTDLEAHMWNAEQEFQPYLYYLIYQTHLDSTMRPILVDWMFEVSAEYCLARETVYLAINYVDRFLSASPTNLPADGTPRSVIDRKTLQLLGVCCLWIASKVEEIFPPSPEDFAITTDHAYNAQQVIAMEPVILKVLGWRLHAQTPYSWLKVFLKKSALLLYEEFKRRATLLFEVPPSGSVASAGYLNPQNPLDNPMSPSRPPTTPGSTPMTPHQQHQQFSLLQLDFLHEMEYLLSAAWFIRMMEYLDVLSLDMHSLRFYPSQLAASVLFVVHQPGSALHDLISQATSYTYKQLLPCINIILLFKDMPYRGPPSEARRNILTELKIPYDEFHSRQVHNPEGRNFLNTAMETLANRAAAAQQEKEMNDAASAASSSSSASSTAANTPEEDMIEAYCHTNIFRNLPHFLGGTLWSELHVRRLLRPLRNAGYHQLPGMWMLDPNVRHDDPSTYGHLGLPKESGLEAFLDSSITAAAITAVAPNADQILALASDIAPVQPATEAFMAAAAKPYTRLPKDAIRMGDRGSGRVKNGTAAASSTSTESSAATAASSTNSASLPPVCPPHPVSSHSRISAMGLSRRERLTQEWDDTSEEEEEEESSETSSRR